MATTASAQDNAPKVPISENGRKGDPGTNGTAGSGFNLVRKSLIDNPLCHLFKTNKLVETAAPTGTDSDVTWTRSTIATFVDRYGVVQTAAIDAPREEKEGFLIEGSSTNNVLHSEDFSNVLWVKAGSVTVSLSGEFVGGSGLEYWELDGITGGGDQLRQNLTPIANEVTTVSAIAKSGTNTTLRLRINQSDTIEDRNTTATFDLTLGTVISGSGIGFLHASIKELASGEWLCQYSHEVSANPTTMDVRLQTDLSGGNVLATAVQVEALPFATSYIKTVAATTTRTADIPSIALYNNFIFDGQGKDWSLVVTLSDIKIPGGGEVPFLAGIEGARPQFQILDTGAIRLLTDGAVMSSSAGLVSDGENVMVTMVYSNGELFFYTDGVFDSSVVGDLSFNTPVITMTLGHQASSYSNTPQKDLRFYDFALNQDEITYLSGQ